MNASSTLVRFFKQKHLYFVFFAIGITVLLLHTTHMGWFICDDAYITLRYAQQWAFEGAPFFNATGNPVEGYTNFLWMAIFALVHMLRLNASLFALLASTISGVSVLFGLVFLFNILLPEHEHRFLRIASTIFLILLTVCFAPFAFWVSTGMETMFFTALLLFSVIAVLRFSPTRKSTIITSLLWSAVALTRPEGVLLGLWAFTVLIFFPFRNEGFRSRVSRYAAVALTMFVSIVLTHLLWRYFTYGQWLPLTYYAKVSGINPTFFVRHGAAYVRAFVSVFFLIPLVIASIIAIFSARTHAKTGRARWFLATMILLFTVHVIRSGGDFMAMFRFLIPIWPLFSALAVVGIVETALWLFRLSFIQKLCNSTILTAILLVTIGLPIVISSWRFEQNSIASERPQFMMESVAGMIHFAQDRARIGSILRKVLPKSVRDNTFMVVGGAGALSYESRIGRIIDTFGLLDPEVAHMRIQPGSFTKPGHLKQASWERIRSLNADILCNPGIAWIGRGQPPTSWFKTLETQWPFYTPFCIVAHLSHDDQGRQRTHYCCLRKKNRLEQLTLHTVSP